MPDRDATIKINVAANNLTVTANYTPAVGNGRKLTPNEVLSQLESMDINTGIKQDVIQKMCASEKVLNLIGIAEGVPPGSGEKARIEFYVKLDDYGKVIEKENGNVDFHDLGDICSASKGDALYRKIPPTIGEAGIDVFGNEFPGLAGNDLKIVTGHGTEIDKIDPDLVRATIEGEVFLKDGIIQVSEVHNVKGDVDFSTGNIRFKGSIVVSGTVKSGFEVIADGNIEIKGNVEDATVISGNDVIIQGGCTGTGEGVVKSKNDVYVKFVENQRIEADRDIIINGAAYHATLLAGRSIIAKGKKGTIVGGLCEAKTSVEAGYFGAVACTATRIKIGIDPKIAEKIQSIESEIEQTRESIEKIEKSVIFLYRQKIDSKGVLPPDKQALLEKLEKVKKAFPQKLEALNKDKIKMLKKLKEVDKAFAVAEKGVYPKVQVYIGNQWISNEDTLGPSRFKLVGSEVVRLSK